MGSGFGCMLVFKFVKFGVMVICVDINEIVNEFMVEEIKVFGF